MIKQGHRLLTVRGALLAEQRQAGPEIGGHFNAEIAPVAATGPLPVHQGKDAAQHGVTLIFYSY
jgi:hypothetical protein